MGVETTDYQLLEICLQSLTPSSVLDYIVATNLFRHCSAMTYGDKKTQFGGFYVPKSVFDVRWISPKVPKQRAFRLPEEVRIN